MSSPKKITGREWQERFKTVTKGYTKDQYAKVFSFEDIILKGIGYAVKYSDLLELSSIDEKIANYYLELLCKFAPEIVNENLTKYSLFRRARILTSKRMKSWKDELLKQRDTTIRNRNYPVIERDEDGEIIDIGFGCSQDWDLGPNGLNPYRTDPETICIRNTERDTFAKAFDILSSMKNQHTRVYLQIIPLLLSGIRVGEKHAKVLGIRKRDVAARVFECIKVMKEIIAGLCPATAEKQRIIENQKFLSHKSEKRTFKELKESYRESTKIPEPVTIRDWKVTSIQRKKWRKVGKSPALNWNLFNTNVSTLQEFNEVA